MSLRFVQPLLSYVEGRLFAAVRQNLQQLVAGQWGTMPNDHDRLFAPHTTYVGFACQNRIPLRAIALWERIRPEVESAETILGSSIHQGAPLYNTGLCHFASGSFDRAAQYIDAAGEADQRLDRGPSRLLAGGGLAESLLIDPLEPWIGNTFGTEYQKGTGAALSKDELKDILSFLDVRRSDAIVFLGALHRLQSQMQGPDNLASGLQRARALADLLIVLESSLKQWQSQNPYLVPSTTTLYPRVKDHLVAGSPVQRPFQDAECRHPNQDWGMAATVNTMLTAEVTEFDATATTAEAAGIALYVSCRLRNALLHVLDDSLTVYQGTTELVRSTAFALVSIKASLLGKARQLGTL